jgi:hypothetical protein
MNGKSKFQEVFREILELRNFILLRLYVME